MWWDSCGPVRREAPEALFNQGLVGKASLDIGGAGPRVGFPMNPDGAPMSRPPKGHDFPKEKGRSGGCSEPGLPVCFTTGPPGYTQFRHVEPPKPLSQYFQPDLDRMARETLRQGPQGLKIQYFVSMILE